MIIIAITIIISMLIGSLAFWGIGNLIIFVFGISYTWTLLHGFAVYLVLKTLKDILWGQNKMNKDNIDRISERIIRKIYKR